MPSLNIVTLAGNLTRDPELRYTQSGSPVVNFGLAINEKWKDKDGNAKESVCFVDVEAWGRQAEAVAEYLHKGSPAIVVGGLKMESWEAKDGTKRTKIKVRARQVQFLGGGKKGEEAAPEPDAAAGGERSDTAAQPDIGPDDSEAPF